MSERTLLYNYLATAVACIAAGIAVGTAIAPHAGTENAVSIGAAATTILLAIVAIRG